MSGFRRHRSQVGKLDCLIVDLAPDPTRAVVLCHGFGAPGTDLVPLADAIARQLRDPLPPIRFVFPAAPLQPPELAPFGGRAWWHLNMAALLAAMQANSFEQLFDSVPPGLDQAADALVSCVSATLESLAPADRDELSPRYLLGGFSQGAMLATHVALSGRVPAPELLVQFSGTLICRPAWRASLEAGRLAETGVLQSHGTADDILPFSAAESLRELMEPHCQSHTFLPFHGPHTIPAEALTALADRL